MSQSPTQPFDTCSRAVPLEREEVVVPHPDADLGTDPRGGIGVDEQTPLGEHSTRDGDR